MARRQSGYGLAQGKYVHVVSHDAEIVVDGETLLLVSQGRCGGGPAGALGPYQSDVAVDGHIFKANRRTGEQANRQGPRALSLT